MSDRRFFASNGRVAHVSLEGRTRAERFVEGRAARVARRAWLRSAPNGPVDRQLQFGDPFTVLDQESGEAFGISGKDGYVGYLRADALWNDGTASHRVAVRTTWGWGVPDLKTEPLFDLHLNARVNLMSVSGRWAEIEAPGGSAFVPKVHLGPLGRGGDPVEVARLMLGTPYLWGGNTGFGIDCSGLVQAAFLGAARACPPDSDLQRDLPGEALDPEEPLARGDLVFWTGHVALVTDPETLIHANAFHMQVAEEPVEAAIGRIRDSGGGDPALRLRPRQGDARHG